MARSDSDITGFPAVSLGSSGGEAHYNAMARYLDIILQPSVIDKDLTAPPGSPSDGDCYYINGTPTGDWAGEQYKLAQWFGDIDAWVFADVAIGYIFWVQDENQFYSINGSGVLVTGPA